MPYIKCFYEDLDPEILEKAKQEVGETDEVKAQGLRELKELIKDIIEMPYIKYFYEDLDPEIIEKAKRERGETEEVKARGLEDLKKLIKDEPDFYPCTDELFLLRFLRFRKFDVEKAFTALKNYYTFKASNLYLLPSDVEHILDTGITTILEYRGPDGEGVGYHQCGLTDNKFKMDELLALGVFVTEIGLTKEFTQFTGYSFIMDLKGFSLRQAMHWGTYSTFYKIWSLFINGSPSRCKALHIVNVPFHMDAFLNLGKRFLLTEKQKKRFHVHGSNLGSLHKFIPPDILPEELGGKQGPASEWATKYKNIVLSMEDHIVEMGKYGFKTKNK